MIIDNNFIAYEYQKDQYVPKEVYSSGKKEENNIINKYSPTDKTPAVLTLKDDIINSDGYGLKSGYYNVIPDKYLDFLLIYQAGNLKAKVPVLKWKFLKQITPNSTKLKKWALKNTLVNKKKNIENIWMAKTQMTLIGAKLKYIKHKSLILGWLYIIQVIFSF